MADDARWAQWMPDATALVCQRLTNLDDRRLWRLTVAALVVVLDAGQAPASWLEVLDQLDSRRRVTRSVMRGTARPRRGVAQTEGRRGNAIS